MNPAAPARNAVVNPVSALTGQGIPGLLAEPAPFVRFIPGFGDSSLNFTLICQVREFVDRAIRWMDSNTTATTKERVMLLYAWNENGEGACRHRVSAARGRSIARVLRASNGPMGSHGRKKARASGAEIPAPDSPVSPGAQDLHGYGDVVSFEDGHYTLRVPKAETARITERLLADLPVVDLLVEDPPIEEVIESVFAQGANEE